MQTQEYESERPTYPNGSPSNKKKRPSSNYVKLKSQSYNGGQEFRNFEKVRNNIQLSLIEQVNSSKQQVSQGCQEPSTSVSTDPTDPTIETVLSVGDEQECDPRRTRAQKVHVSQKLPPVFRKVGNLTLEPLQAVCGQNQSKTPKVESSQKILPKPKPSAPLTKVTVNDPETQPQAPPMNERQIKYLGLIIEKDDEQLIEVVKDSYQGNSASSEGVYYVRPEDPVKRQYYPIRDKYIRIVKGCRRTVIESYEKRGRKDFKRTSKSLFRLAKAISPKINFY